MDKIPLIDSAQLMPFTSMLKDIGACPDTYLRRAKLPLHVLDTPGLTLAERPLWLLADDITLREGVAGFGFLAWHRHGIQSMTELIDALGGAPTLLMALNLFAQLARDTSSDAGFWLELGRNRPRFVRSGIKSITVGRWPVEQYTVALMIDILRLALGPDWCPDEVYLEATDTPGLEHCTELQGARVHTGQRHTAIALDAEALSLPLIRTPSPIAAHTSITHRARDFPDALRLALTPYVHEQLPGIHTAAEIIGASTRTLQRRLSAAGTTYQGLVDQLRFESVLPLLQENERRLTDIALELGYSDPAHFSRAFRRWSGVSPSQYRRDRRRLPLLR